jgi:hypothetical protein
MQSGALEPAGAPEGGALELHGVWFAYPSRPAAWVLQDFSLDVRPGNKASPSSAGGSQAAPWMHLARGPGISMPFLLEETAAACVPPSNHSPTGLLAFGWPRRWRFPPASSPPRPT